MGKALDRLKADQRKYHALLNGLIAKGVEASEAEQQAKLSIAALQAKRRTGSNRGRKVVSDI